jgi:2-methylisocitrate lyase-like PEP mutase family enzyme
MASKYTEMRRAFAGRMRKPGTTVAPGVGDALGARMVQSAGFDCVYMSGYAVEATYGKPDVGLLTLSEMAQRAGQICDAVDIPLVSDADTGYGNVTNVARTVREFERAGACAIQIEDQALPKKCGSMKGKNIVSTQEMVGKIKAALDAREDDNFLIIARTDAWVVEGQGAAMDRLAAYREAGADLVMALGPYSEAEARTLIQTAPGPIAYLSSESFTMPMIPVAEQERLGVRLVIFPLALTLAAAKSMERTLQQIKSVGTTQEFAKSSMLSWAACNAVLGIDDIHRIEAEFGA